MPRDTPASFGKVQEMAEQLHLDAACYRRSLEIARLTPGRERLLRQIDRFLIAVGALFVVAGIAVFFAWNWDELAPAAFAGITLPGSLYLAFVAVAPSIAGLIFDVPVGLSGVSILIVAGVALETMKQIESQLMMRSYERFLS